MDQYGYGMPWSPPFPSWPDTVVKDSGNVFSIFVQDSLVTVLNLYAPCLPPCLDTAYEDSSYHNHKQNHYRIPERETILVDSVGPAYGDFGDEGTNSDYSYQLIWYHKASGEEWGTYTRVIPLAVTDLQRQFSAKLFPNPTDGNFNIQLSMVPDTPLSFDMFDTRGQKIYTQKISAALSQINLKNLPKGFYVWEIQSGTGAVKRGKLVFE
jgi:hypothetical protein